MVKRRPLIIIIGVAALAGACWERFAERNDDRAYFTREGQVYRVEMKGLRFPLVHDPVSLILARTREETFTLELPRIEGVIEGSEIPRGSADYRYSGRVVIASGKMQVDLYYPDDGVRRASSWNDEYTLLPKDSDRSR
jgi:hypothetical protein